ncbi:uncharacterized protein LOC117297699 [Asterias rubens]|uniref:uncharacterized protein LOC117297699 n=1 Tax=Asterias rubens TaxID=7604 RepID=UPI0014556651|nr:uncharacterized protein LOC117297699 [Asterias rubens]
MVVVTDYNECEYGPSVCDVNADCTNTPSSHTCTCRAGYTGNGDTCTECDDGKYGLNCASECSCVSRGTCNKVTGQCTCNPIPGFDDAVCDKVDFQMSLTRADGMTGPVLDTQAIDDVELICTVNVLPADLVGPVLIRYPDRNEFPTTLDSNQHVYRETVMDVHPGDSGDYTCVIKILPRPSDSIEDKTSVYSLSVVDLDECATNMFQCDVNANCVNEDMEGGYNCVCNDGYRYSADGSTCEDIDECTDATVMHNCVMNADCTNTAGRFYCTCKPGYSGTGNVACQDNEPPQFQDGTCPSDIDEVAGAGMSDKMVSWINPSATDTTGDAPTIVCTPQSGSDFMIGTQEVICTATDAAGNQATPDCIFEVAVTDYNECEDDPSVCDVNAVCTNTPGRHTCTCKAGYTGNGDTCTECDDGKYGLNCASECSCVSRGTCNKVTGQCTCNPIPGFDDAVCDKVDFQMSLTRADGMTGPVLDTQANDDVELICTVNVLPADLVGPVLIRYPDRNEFPTTLDSNQHVYRKTVMDVHPRDSGDYTCVTKIQPRPSDSIEDKTSVYSLSVVDLNECATNMFQCDVNAYCVNEDMEGGYNCVCNNGYRYTADGSTCEDIDECTDATVMHNCVMNADCTNTAGSFYCTCKPGYSGTGNVACQVCNQGYYGLGCTQVCTCVAPVPALNDVMCNNVDGTCSCDQEFPGKACDKSDLLVTLTSDPFPVLDTPGVDNVALVCSVNLHSRDLDGSVDITFQNGAQIPSTTLSNPSEGRYERTLNDISLADSGTYRCTATTRINGVPLTEHGDVTLDVLAPGRIISVTEKVEGELMATVSVDCIVYADPAPTITWYDPDSMVIVNDNLKYSVSYSLDVGQGRLTSSLSVRNLIRDDGGSYKCETQNDLTDEKDEKLAEVVIIEVPEVGPVAATPVSSEAIDVTWVVTYDGNLLFTCIVEYRVDPSGIWMESTPGPSQQSQAHQVTGLEAFTLYSIRVTCRNRVGNGIPSVLITSVTSEQAAPSAPRNPEVTEATSESLTVAWEEPEMKRGTIASYRVTVEGVVETYQTSGPGNPAPLFLNVTGLNPFTNYNLFVTAFNEEDLVQLMGEDSMTITEKTAESTPTSPLNVKLNSTGKTCVVTWDRPQRENGIIMTYKISRLAHFYDGLDPDLSKTDTVEILGDQRSYSIDKIDLQAYAQYRFAITASTTVGKGPQSETTVATCNSPPSAPQAPARPVVSDYLLDSVTDSSFKVVVAPTSQQNGPISCLELTLVQLNRNEGIDGKVPDILYHPDQLGTYQEAQESMAPYVAVVFTGSEITDSMEVEIGVGGLTSCGGGNLSRRKRRQSKREHVGDNGALKPNTRYTAFLRAYSVFDNGTEVYSTSPLMQSIQTGETPSNNVAIFAVIGLLSTLLIVAVAVVIVFVMRSKVKRESHNAQDTRTVGAPVEMNSTDYEVTMDSSTEAVVYEDVGLPSWAVRWKILRRDLGVDGTVLGRGNFGEVRSGTVDQGGQRTKCAIKILKGRASPTDRQDFLEEFRTMTKIGYHPNVVSLIGACQHQDVLYVALEYLPNGDLRNHLRSSRPDTDSEPSLTSEQLIKFALDVAMGMEHLASSAVIHRDLAARNILLGRGFVAKVSDFGLSRGEDIYVQTSMRRVPTRWLSIESIMLKTYTTKSDVWSYGILLWEIATLGGTPYPSIRTKDLASQLTDGYRMSKPQNCDEKIYMLMIRCWEENPTNRPSFSDLVTVLSGMNESQINHTYMAFQRPHYENFSVIRPELDDN